jgi:3-oxoacyl-[acyl-carrier protein] reductase
MGKLDGRVALVTGGARGIGRAIALAFAAEGADVAVNDLRLDEALESVVAAIKNQGRRAWALPADVADEHAVQAMVDHLLAEAGRVDILVNNAGIANTAPLVAISAETWDRMIAVHLRGAFLCTRAVLPQMLERGSGKIINLGSQLGQIGREGWTHYAAAKGGIIAFTKALAREVSPAGVQVNCIAPGPISTGLVKSDPAADERLKAALPSRRFGTVEDVAPTAVFLASADADYYVGQTLGPNGGDVML